MKKNEIGLQDPHCNEYHYNHKRICWTAIFTGALVGLGVAFLLNLFGIAIGLSAVTMGTDGGTGLAIGGLIGLCIAIFVSMFVAGYSSGYLGRLSCPRRNLGVLYGFTTWTVALLLSAAVMAHVSNYVSAYSRTMVGTNVVLTHPESSDANTVTMSKKTTSHQQEPVANVVTTANTLAYAAFVVFGLFFLGAFASCVGASCAMTCRRDD
jgi:hypothetical protein